MTQSCEPFDVGFFSDFFLIYSTSEINPKVLAGAISDAKLFFEKLKITGSVFNPLASKSHFAFTSKSSKG